MRVSVIFGSRVILPKNIIILYARLNCTRISHEKRIAARQLSERSNIPASQGNCGEIEKFIMYGGKSAVLSVGAEIGGNEVECPTCKAKNPKGQKICSSCGAKLRKNCPHCGAEIESGTKSCPQCGGSAEEPAMVCVKCGAVLKEGQAFCPSCGTKQEKPCPSCGAVMESDAKFCPVCGASGDDVKLCPNCKAEIKGNAAFCSKCGTNNQLKIRAVPKSTVTPVFMSVDFFWRV